MDFITQFVHDQPAVATIVGGGILTLLLVRLSTPTDSKKVAVAEAAYAELTPSNGAGKASKKKKKKKSSSRSIEIKKEEAVPEKEVAQDPEPKKAQPPQQTAASNSAPKKKKKKKTSTPPKKPKKTVVVEEEEESDDDDDALLMFARGRRVNNGTVNKAVVDESSNSGYGNRKSTFSSVVARKKTGETEPEEEKTASDGFFCMTLSSDDIPVIIGPKGSTIQNLQTLTGARLDIAKGVYPPQLRITGTEIEIAYATEEVQSLLSAKANETAHSITLSGTSIKGPDGVKAIIGRGGSTIQEIQSTTGCQLNASVDTATVVISGPTQDAVNRAVTMCTNAVFGATNATVDLGSRSMVFMICGPNFTNLQKVQRESGARLDVERGGTILTISGDADHVDNAKRTVEQLMTQYGGATMELEASKIGAVFGKGGTNVRKIQERTGAHIEIVQKNEGGIATCKIVGEPDAVKEAQIMIQKSLSGEIELKPGEVQESVELGVGTSAVIGRGGSKISELEKTHGVKINVQNTSGTCSIVGKKAAVEGAKTAIEAIVQPLIEKDIAEAKVREQSDQLGVGGGGWDAMDETETGW